MDGVFVIMSIFLVLMIIHVIVIASMGFLLKEGVQKDIKDINTWFVCRRERRILCRTEKNYD